MKTQKKILSLLLSLTLLATVFSSLGNIFSSAENFEELKVTKTLEAYDSATANSELEKDWTNDKGIINVNANPDHSVAGDGTNIYADYKLEMTGTSNIYAKEGGKYYVDWADNTVESVSYTVLPGAWLGENASFNRGGIRLPIGNGQNLGYGFQSDVGTMSIRSQGVDGGYNWLGRALTYKNGDTTLIAKLNSTNTINEVYKKTAIAVANEIKVTVNYTKTDGKYYLKNIVVVVYPDKMVSNVEGVTATSTRTDNTFTISFSKSIEITDPQFCLPAPYTGLFSGDEAFYNYSYIKDASITYYTNPDNDEIKDFVEAYNKIKNIDVADAEAHKDDIVACMNIYNSYTEDQKKYVGEERYNILLTLYNKAMESQIREEVADFLNAYSMVSSLTVETVKAEDHEALKNCIDIYNGYDDIHKNAVSAEYTVVYELYKKAVYLKTGEDIQVSAMNKNMLSNKEASEQMWQYTYLEDNGFKFSPLTENPNQMYTHQNYFNQSDLGSYGFTFNGKTATQTVKGKSYKAQAESTDNTGISRYASNFINYVKKDFVPENANAVSATVSLKKGSYYIFFGENNTAYASEKKYNDGTGSENDLPRFGIKFEISSDGTVKAYFAYINLTYCTNATFAAMNEKWLTSITYGPSAYSNLLRYSTEQGLKLDMASDKLKINIDLSHKYVQNVQGTDITYIHPIVTLEDSKGNVISQPVNTNDSDKTKPVCNGAALNPSSKAWMPTDVTGLAISSFSSDFEHAASGSTANPYENTLTLYDYDIVGGAAVNALGASVKKTTAVDEQDIRFGFTFGAENTYLTSKGYSVKNYGAVVAINGALNSGDSLTLTSKYADKYSDIGEPQIITNDGAPNYGEQYNVRIGLSAKDSKNLGLVYRVRPYITYAKEGAEDIVIYSEDSSLTNSYTPRSIFSTAKNIAKAEMAKSGFETAKCESYSVNGTDISFETIEAIINGTNTGKSYDKIDGTEVMLAEALTAFTAYHSNLL